MPSVLGLLEEQELAARQRVEVLREEVDRLLAGLRDAEAEWKRFVIARETVSAVLSEPREPAAVEAPGDGTGEVCEKAATGPAVPRSPVGKAAVAGSTVPVWREGLEVSVLAPDYQRIVHVLADHRRTGGDGMLCKQIAAELGLELVSAQVEGVRCKAKRLVKRGWLTEERTGRFVVAASPGGGS